MNIMKEHSKCGALVISTAKTRGNILRLSYTIGSTDKGRAAQAKKTIHANK
jgi:hypothetical protein